MNKHYNILKSFLLAILILPYLGLNAQSNDYEDFSTDILKSNKQYVKSFNPIDYDPVIIDACIIEIINIARWKYNFADALEYNETLENAAKIQSEFMAKKEERTQENVVKSLQIGRASCRERV